LMQKPAMRLIFGSIFLLWANVSRAATEDLAFSSQIQYSTVIQGATDPIYDYVYNDALTGSDTGHYQAAMSYASPGAVTYTSIGYVYTGSKIADGGTSYVTLSFPLDTSNFAAGTAAVSITNTDTDTGGTLTQGGQFTVLAHAAPAIYVQGQIVPLSSSTVVKFQAPTNNFSQAPPAGTEFGASADAQMLGDPPPDVPTAELDLDSVSGQGSSYITTTLAPFTDLPSDDNPGDGDPFEIDANVPALGDYNTVFNLTYSDEQDLPGADAPGSQTASFDVDADVTAATTYWTITVPEPAGASIFLATILCWTARRPGHLRASPLGPGRHGPAPLIGVL